MGWYVPFDRLGQKQLEVLNGITGQLDRPHWVQGFAGTGKFATWADSTLPRIRDALQTELFSALAKAEAEASRRALRKLRGDET